MNIWQRIVVILAATITVSFLCFKIEGNWPFASFSVTSQTCSVGGWVWLLGFLLLAGFGVLLLGISKKTKPEQDEQLAEREENPDNEITKETAKELFQISWDWLKYYQNVVLGAFFSYLTVTGGIFSFWLHLKFTNSSIKHVLLLPIVMGLFFALMTFAATFWAKSQQDSMNNCLKQWTGLQGGSPVISYILLLVFTGLASLSIALLALGIYLSWIPIPAS